MARLEDMQIMIEGSKPDSSASSLTKIAEVYLDLTGLIDLEAEKKKLSKEIEELSIYSKALRNKLGNEEFTNNAPAAVVAKEQEKLNVAQEKLDKLNQQLSTL